MQNILLVVHVLLAIFLVMLILLQQGKGASMASNLTGSTGSAQSVFGSQGAGSFMLKLTGFVALLFFISTLTLNYMAHHATASHEGVIETAQKLSQQQKQDQQQTKQSSAAATEKNSQAKAHQANQSSDQQKAQTKQSESSAAQSQTENSSNAKESQNPAVLAAQKQLNSDGASKQQSSQTGQ